MNVKQYRQILSDLMCAAQSIQRASPDCSDYDAENITVHLDSAWNQIMDIRKYILSEISPK